ncbi:N-6 DNA methylase [Streptomyces sp. NPDC060188]|uniref:N-6 DNA methylase n=1 Tax=Streptomyces sp. NPDC060188 TaxID=3347068 RepID=UPI003666032F
MTRGIATFESVRRALFEVQDMTRGTMDTHDGRDLALALLVCKHLHDEYGQRSPSGKSLAATHDPLSGYEWVSLFDDLARNAPPPEWADQVGAWCVGAFVQLAERASSALKRFPENRRAHLVGLFQDLRLDFASLAHRGLLGDIVEDLLKWRVGSSVASAEFYTPREVVRLLTELARPRAGMRICDPFCGTGGTLVQAKSYVEEQVEVQHEPLLYGEDVNSASYALAAVNLYFHGASVGALKRGDALTDEGFTRAGFDMVLSVPPFGLRLRPEQVNALSPGLLPYGLLSDRAPGDHALLQYMLRLVQERNGTVCTVMTHGPLFRDNLSERAVRTALLDADVIEAVIGLPPDLFQGTGIQTCVLVLRAPGGKAPERRGKVLFVDASREFRKGRGTNVLRGENTARITTAFRSYEDVEGFARVMDRGRLAANDDSLAIRRYVDSTPLPEPQDIRAHMLGGMPIAEIDAEAALLRAYGIPFSRLFVLREPDSPYMDFPPRERRFDAEGLAELARPQEARFRAAFEAWWPCAEADIAGVFPDGRETDGPQSRLARLKNALMSSFPTKLLETGLVPEHALVGTLMDWWEGAGSSLRTWAERGQETLFEANFASLKEDIAGRLESLLGRRRHELVGTYQSWQQKYGLSFREIESQLAGTPETVVLHNPWSEQSAWDFGAHDGGTATRRRQTAARIYELIDTEKTVQAALAKLDVDEQMVLLPLLTDVSRVADGQVERCPLRDVVTTARRGAAPRFGEEPDGVPVVEARNLSERGLDLTQLRHLRPGSSPRPADRLRPGDVLVTGRFMAGRGYRAEVWREQLPVAAYGNNVLRLTPDTARLIPEYLKAWLSQPSIRPRIEAQARFTQRDLYDLSAGRLLDVEIDLPAPPEQRRVAEEMALLEEQRDLRFAQLAKLELIKGTLMEDLRSARTSVNYLD